MERLWLRGMKIVRRARTGMLFSERIAFDNALRPRIKGEPGKVIAYPDAIYHATGEDICRALVAATNEKNNYGATVRKADFTFQGIPIYSDGVVPEDAVYLLRPLSPEEIAKLRAAGLDVFNIETAMIKNVIGTEK